MLVISNITKGRLQNPTAGWPAVPFGSGRLSLFRTIETGRNRTEPPVNRRLGFEAVPNLPTVSLLEGLSHSLSLQKGQFHFLEISVMANSLYEQQRMMLILHGIFISAFSPVYWDKCSYEKPSLIPKSPETQLCGFFWFLVMYMQTALAQCPTFFYFGRLAGMQSFCFKLVAINILYVSYFFLCVSRWNEPFRGKMDHPTCWSKLR